MKGENMENPVAVVTGGTRGIGLGIALWLANYGASVALTFRSDLAAALAAEEKIRGVLKPGRKTLLLQGDAGDSENVSCHYEKVRRELGPAQILVNNAGIMTPKSFDTIRLEDWEETLRVNLSGAFYWIFNVVPDMRAGRFGRIVNISSLAAQGGGVVGPHYAASKAGLLGLTRFSSRELGSFGITVNSIAPAFIRNAGIFVDWEEDKLSSLKEKTLVSRLGDVGDVVRAFAYLIESPFVTGQTVNVNGGASMS
jgi:3-oxoacyl-[acyl-carrier protein] reductase